MTLFAGPSCVVLIGELKDDIPGADTKCLAQMLVETEDTRLQFTWLILLGANYLNFKADLLPIAFTERPFRVFS